MMAAKDLGKVAVLMGGKSSEREVSISSGTGVLNALRSQGVNAEAFDPGKQPLSELALGGTPHCGGFPAAPLYAYPRLL